MEHLGLIDGVVNLDNIGLTHLRVEPNQTVASGFSEAAYAARQAMAQQPDDLQVLVPLTTDEGQPTNYEAVGYIDRGGKPEEITSQLLEGMFDTEIRNDGVIPVDNQNPTTRSQAAEQILVADASGIFRQVSRVPVVDLLVLQSGTRNLYLAPRVSANAFCRQAVTAFSQNQLRRFDFRLRRKKNGDIIID